MQDDMHLQNLRTYIIEGWLSNRYDIIIDLLPYQAFRNKLVIIHGVAMNDKRVIILVTLQPKYWNSYIATIWA